jgi:hypothetical protein
MAKKIRIALLDLRNPKKNLAREFMPESGGAWVRSMTVCPACIAAPDKCNVSRRINRPANDARLGLAEVIAVNRERRQTPTKRNGYFK